MYWRAIIIFWLAMTLVALAADRCPAEVAEFPIPVATIGAGNNYFEIDLGTAAANVRSIAFVANGTCTAPSIGSMGDCSAPYIFPIEMFLSLNASDNVYYIKTYRWIPAGAFAFADTIVPPESQAQLFQTGRETLNLFCFHRYCYWGSEPTDPDIRYVNCTVGSFDFAAPPVLTVEFDPAVPVAPTGWGSVKALYR